MASETALFTPPLTSSPAGLSSEELDRIFDLVRWAPSGDNCQPWRPRVSDDRQSLEVSCDKSQPQAFLDFNWDASRIAIGAFVENIKLAASMFRVPCDIDFANDSEETVWARIKFGLRRTATPDPLADMIEKRYSNRHLYELGFCTPDQLDQILESTSDIPGVDVNFITSRSEMKKIAKAAGIADRIRMRHRQCHQEFHGKIRWTEKEARENPTGFYVKTFEIKRHEAWILRLTRNYTVMRVVDALTGMSRIAQYLASRQVMASGAIGVLQAHSQDPASMLLAGRALQRVWLRANQLGLAFQVLAVAPLFVYRQSQGGEGFSNAENRLIARSVAKTINCTLMFRIGIAIAPSAQTFRQRITVRD